jgi:hypothetical protein
MQEVRTRELLRDGDALDEGQKGNHARRPERAPAVFVYLRERELRGSLSHNIPQTQTQNTNSTIHTIY